jgi:hypothetical protein
VSTLGEHIEIRYGDAASSGYEAWTPVALVGRPEGSVFPVRWLRAPSDVAAEVIADVRRELDFYLVDKGERDPWAYAIYHCTTAANLYSAIHWSYWPAGRQGGRVN